MANPWTKDEFMAALAKLKATGKFKSVLDEADNPGSNGGGEWYSYAYSPQLQSFGGDLIDRSSNTTADGAINGQAAIDWATWFRSLVTQGYMPPSGTSPNDDFLNGKTAIEWDGSWDAAKNIKALGNDLAIIPPVDFGAGPKIGGGSWQWAMTSSCGNTAAAEAFLKFMRQDKYFASMANATGTIPAAYSAAAKVPGYQKGGELNVFLEYAKKYAEVRPVTPAYPYISTVFAKAVADILSGGDPKSILDQAASQIDQNIKSNDNYSS
jgi:multiple sugar transport system substrate-binding protein